MKTEIREFKYARFLLIIPENQKEKSDLDLISGQKAVEEMKMDAILTCDDVFNPYIRILIPERRSAKKIS